MNSRLLAISALAAAVTACGSLFPPAERVFDAAIPELSDFTLRVVDESGLVVSMRSMRFDPPLNGVDAEARAFPDRNELQVGWIGGMCNHRPTLTVTGSSGALHLNLEVNAGPGPSPFTACSATGYYFGMTVALNQPVQQDSITLVVVN
jgi:hypothetical protein